MPIDRTTIAVAPLRAANVGVQVAWSATFADRFAGIPLKNVGLAVRGRPFAPVRGDAMVTRTGVEGGPVYAIGAAIRDALDRDGRCVLEVDLRPDLTVDRLGWNPPVRLLRGAIQPGPLGVLQAEHNLLLRLHTLPTANNLRQIVDSQRLLSREAAPLAKRVDPNLGSAWYRRAATYARLRTDLRDIGGVLGTGQRRDAVPLGVGGHQDVLGLARGVEEGGDGARMRLGERFAEHVADHRQLR